MVLALVCGGSWSKHVRADSYDDEGHPEESGEPSEEPPLREEPKKGLEAGGLAAPPPLDGNQSSKNDIEKELERADREDSGRGLDFVALGADVGFGAVDLGAFSQNLAPGTVSGSGGLVSFGVSAYIRALYFTLGPHFRAGSLDSLSTWSLLLESTMRIPMGDFEPFFGVGGGVLQASGITSQVAGEEVQLTATGLDLRALAGVDYYLSDTLSVGAQADLDFLFLSRSGASQRIDQNGDASGFAATGLFRVLLHF